MWDSRGESSGSGIRVEHCALRAYHQRKFSDPMRHTEISAGLPENSMTEALLKPHVYNV